MFFTVHVSNNRVPLLEPRLNVYNAIISKQTTSWKVGCETFYSSCLEDQNLNTSKLPCPHFSWMNFESSSWTNQSIWKWWKTESQPVSCLLICRQQIETGTAEVSTIRKDIFFCICTHFQSKHLLFVRTNWGHQMLLFPYLNAL